MAFIVCGISHHTSPVALRERMAIAPDRAAEVLAAVRRRFEGAGVVVLNTCNRMELYLHAHEPLEDMFAALRALLSEWTGVPVEEFVPHLYEREGGETVGHLFRVAASLDSMVVGEDQILGQVHDAYSTAQREECTDKITSAVFQRAFKVAKEVRTKSSIGAGKISVASVAVDLAVSIFTDLADKTVMIIGSGDTGETALKSLVERGVGSVIVANRTVARASDLADRFDGEAVALKDLDQHLHRADIVITSTAAAEPILRVDDFQHALRRRDKAPMFAIDIAVPRDIDERVDELDNVYVYNIDDLRKVAEENMAARQAEVEACMEIIDTQVARCMKWMTTLQAEPTIVSMSQELHAIRERELEKTLKALPDLTDKQREEVAYLTKRIVNNILQRPMTQLKEEVAEQDPNRVLHLVKRLFGLEEGT